MDKNNVILDGFHAVKHALRFDAEFVDIICYDKLKTEKLAIELAPDISKKLRAKLRVVSIEEFKKLSNPPHPTGVVGIAKRPVQNSDILIQRSSPAILLENPRHLGNIGAVIRVAAAAGSSGVIATGEVDPWSPTVIRGSAGLHYALPVLRVKDTKQLSGPLIVFDPEGKSLQNFTITNNVILAFGTERHGISDDLKQNADHIVSLPMQSGVSSINLSTSVAVALYHWRLNHPTNSISMV